MHALASITSFAAYDFLPFLNVGKDPVLLANKIEVVISAMGATPEQAVQVMFPSPYAALYLGVYAPKSAAVTGRDGLGSLRPRARRRT